jgi:hypothetical protein
VRFIGAVQPVGDRAGAVERQRVAVPGGVGEGGVGVVVLEVPEEERAQGGDEIGPGGRVAGGAAAGVDADDAAALVGDAEPRTEPDLAGSSD